MSIAGLRRSAQKMGGSGKSKGKGGYYASWSPPSFDKMKKDLTPQEEPHVAEPIVLIEGEYADPYSLDKMTGQPEIHAAFHYRFHRFTQLYKGKKQFRTMSCLRGPEQHNPKQCVTCLLVDNKTFDEKNSGARSAWVFNIAHLVAYHSMPLTKDSQIQMKKDGSGPIMVDRECRNGTIGQRVYARMNNKQCDGCQAQAPLKMGSHRYWQLGKGHLDDLFDFNDKVLSKICFYTNTGIIQTGFNCGKCSTKFLDIASSGFTNQHIKDFSEGPQRCNCGHVGLPVPEYESGYTADGYSRIQNFQMPVGPNGQPFKARPINLFDVAIWVQREGENTDSKPVVTKWCRLTEYPHGNGKVDITSYVNESLVANPFDFEDLFSTDTDAQAKQLDVANPYSQGQQQQNFNRYNQLPQGGYAGPMMPPQQPMGVPGQVPGQMPGQWPQQPQQQGFPNQQYTQQPPPQQPFPGQAPQQPQYPPQQPQIAQPYPQQPQQPQFPAPIGPPPQQQPQQPQQGPGVPGFPPPGPGRPNW